MNAFAHIYIHIQMVLTYKSLILWWCKSDMHSIDSVLRILIFSWVGDMWSDIFSRCWAATAAPSQLCEHSCEQSIYLQPFWTHTTILFFTFSTVFNTWDIQHLENNLNRFSAQWFCPVVGYNLSRYNLILSWERSVLDSLIVWFCDIGLYLRCYCLTSWNWCWSKTWMGKEG